MRSKRSLESWLRSTEAISAGNAGDKRVFGGEIKFYRDYSSTAAAVPLPSQGKVKVATDYLFCIIVILMISGTENIRITAY